MAAVTETAPRGAWARLEQRPGFRTLASPSFRRVVGVLLLTGGLLYTVALLIAVEHAGGFQVDFIHAYRRASLDLLAGHSPYFAQQFTEPFPANGRYGWYLYPPTFAQLLTPVALLPEGVSALAWLGLQAAMLYAAAWLGASAAGASRSVDRALWTGVAVVTFLPVQEVLWTGNMGGPLALAVGALMAARGRDGSASRRGVAAGLLTAAVAVVKLSPAAWVPAALRAGGGIARGVLFGGVALLAISVALAPGPWRDYVSILPNLVNADARYPNNLAPALVALNLGASDQLVSVVRVVTVIAALGLIGASAWWAAREDGWPFSIAAAVVGGLLLPATAWYHYLVLFLPLAAFAWVREAARTRIVLVASGVVIGIGMTMPFLAAAGAGSMAAVLLAALWPRVATPSSVH